MRVIAGKARRLQLKTPEGMDTRPTTDRIKETLFNLLRGEIEGSCFLDLFSGSGGIGIEALSRGAAKACFVEQNRKAADIIRENLAFTRLAAQAEVMNCPVAAALPALQGKEQFDVVFMDPPYGRGLEKEVLANAAFYHILKEKALVIIEADLETELGALSGFRQIKEKRYKTNKHIFLEKVSGK
ncbi:MAG: 16S rRNA (guanine(966)-N(2))-methyltransferase RsmD [Bacteroidales bacterium]|nr:16S rRNA (guanine(966)-N(2))-methyltransferase RsmD [Clostridium sp.]MCM1203135.1 16S rRNA (guanine(966)-N(2))-methyltransferase RsmD [Bacteroidales bacterium]